MEALTSSESAFPPGARLQPAPASVVDQYVPAFDWLRAALAITVMLYHDAVITWHGAGALAVQIFFALSGWLIGGILLETRPADLPRFYFNRAIRIWAPYYVALFLLVAASLVKDHPGQKWFEFVTYKVLMVWNLFGSPQLGDFRSQMPLQGTGNHFWSVNAEEQFYLACPLLLVLAPRWGRSLLLWSGLAFLAFATRNTYGSIVVGVLGAIAARRFGPVHLKFEAKLAALGAFVFCAIGLASRGPFELLAPIFGLCCVLLLASPGKASRIGKIAGGMSYPLYLNHWIGVFVGNALLSPFGLRDSIARHGFAALFNIALAILLYLYVERPLLARRGLWYSEKIGRNTRALAYTMFLVGIGFAALQRA